MMQVATYLLLAICCLVMGVNGRSWIIGDPFAELFNPSSPTAATTKGDVTTADTSGDSEVPMRKTVQGELQKMNSPTQNEDESNDVSTESTADMIRRIIAEELAKATPPSTTTTTTTPAPIVQQPNVPIWQSWANTKYWAKQPGVNGQSPPGFIGTLQNTYGQGGDAGGQMVGGPAWVWSQMANKWSDDDDKTTVVPPSQIVKRGDWQVVLPP